MAEKPAIVLVHGFCGGAAHWGKVITELHHRGFGSLHAVENPLTSLADDAERTRKMVKQIDGPVVLVGHSYGGAVITEAGDLPNVTGLVYIAAFAPDAGESPGQISQEKPPAAFENLAPDSDGYLWVKQDKFHESFAQDLSAEEALVMAVTQKAPLASTFGDNVTPPAGRAHARPFPHFTHRPQSHPQTEG
ncbi:alpha/beta fold hydrolase, partial [Streptomyces sp. NPDC059802]|uniref:alpha/beta fold hydrolase n=1 Tax=Streptomyces sp. NPDC059802 TaxID=3346952 RepID=UPI003652E45E